MIHRFTLQNRAIHTKFTPMPDPKREISVVLFFGQIIHAGFKILHHVRHKNGVFFS